MINANRLFLKKSLYPLHLGVTEAGSKLPGTIKNSIGMGILLSEGIGDTIRVSLSDNPIEEVKVGKKILRSLGLRKDGVEVTSCPTCARTNIDVIKIAEEIENKTEKIKKPIHVAIMGCAVNGLGECKKADIGIVGGINNTNLLYKKGEIIGKIPKEKIVESLLKEIKEIASGN